MSSCKPENLRKEVLDNSQASDWDSARGEWALRSVYDEYGGTCVCSHYPITQHCVIYNSKTTKELTVGNQCLEAVMGHTVKLARDGYVRISRNIETPPNKALAAIVESQGMLSQKDAGFYTSMIGMRKVSRKQMLWLVSCNSQVKAALSQIVLQQGI